MEEILKEKTVAYTMWQAEDGTQFSDSAECKKYEESAWGILFARLKKCVLNEGCPENVGLDYEEGSDNEYVVIAPKTQEDLDTANRLLAIAGNSGRLNEEDLNMPLFFGYRFYGNHNIDWCWFYRITDMVNTATKGKYVIKENE